MKCFVRPWLKLALPVLLVLAVYFQSISNPFSHFDDPFIVKVYGLNSALSFQNIITPGGGFYYRPLVNLSYWLDFRWWGMAPSFMHLENIVAHLANVLLVYLITARLPVASDSKSLPFLSALLFGLHPINSESVNWIAGRTDVFAGMFVLLAFYFLIRAVQEQSSRLAVFAFIVAFVGALAKETSIMFIPAAFMVATFWPVESQDEFRYKAWRKRYIFIPIIISTLTVLSLLMFLYFKGHGNNAVSLIFEGGTNIVTRAFEAFGFYVKKLLFPFPLNVAILEVDPLYAIAGVVSLCFLVLTLRRMGIPGVFLAAAVLFTLPALVVATTAIAWTPLGERYLYIPSAFMVVGSLELAYRFLERRNAVNLLVPIVSIIIALAAIATFQRGLLWGDNFAMMEDIVAKSPHFGVARNEYGILLKQAGRYKEAINQFKIAAEQKNQASVNRMIRLNLIGMQLLGKQHDEVRQILLSEIGQKSDGDIELLKLLNVYDEYSLVGMLSPVKKRQLVTDITATNESLYLKTREAHYLYRAGQLMLSIGNNEKAALFFRKASENAPHDAYYKEPARSLAEKLGKK